MRNPHLFIELPTLRYVTVYFVGVEINRMSKPSGIVRKVIMMIELEKGFVRIKGNKNFNASSLYKSLIDFYLCTTSFFSLFS